MSPSKFNFCLYPDLLYQLSVKKRNVDAVSGHLVEGTASAKMKF